MGRSEKMLYRVRRKLVDRSEIPATEIYDALQMAQQDIIVRVNAITKDIDVTTVADQSAYTLQADIRSIKSIIKPTGDAWNLNTKFTLPKNWDETTRIVMSGEPLFWMFDDNMTEMNLHPAPTTSGETIILQCYMKDSTTEIGEGVEPEVESYWDKCMTYFALAEFVDPKYWTELYENEIRNLRHVPTQSQLEPKIRASNW